MFSENSNFCFQGVSISNTCLILSILLFIFFNTYQPFAYRWPKPIKYLGCWLCNTLPNLKLQTSTEKTMTGMYTVICSAKLRPCLSGLTQKFLSLKCLTDITFLSVEHGIPHDSFFFSRACILPNDCHATVSYNKWHLFFPKYFLAVQTQWIWTWSHSASLLLFPLHHLIPTFRRLSRPYTA